MHHDGLNGSADSLLTLSEAIKLLEMIHSLVSCTTIGQFIAIAKGLENLIGVDHIIFGVPSDVSDSAIAVSDLNISYPQEWVDLYQDNEFWRIDPVVTASLTSDGPQHWTDIYQHFPPTKKFLQLAQDFGLKDGYSCLSRSAVGFDWSIISVSGEFTTHAATVTHILERIGPHFHLALSTVLRNKEAESLQRLTKRETEVLKWLQHGKTSWEISVILKISESTVNFHVQNIKGKLNVVNRIQAVACALNGRLING